MKNWLKAGARLLSRAWLSSLTGAASGFSTETRDKARGAQPVAQLLHGIMPLWHSVAQFVPLKTVEI